MATPPASQIGRSHPPREPQGVVSYAYASHTAVVLTRHCGQIAIELGAMLQMQGLSYRLGFRLPEI